MSKRLPLLLAFALAVLAFPPGAAAAKVVPGQYIVVLKDGASQSQTIADHKRKDGAHVVMTYGHALKGYTAKLSAAALAKVKADPRVDFVTPDYEGTPIQAKPPPPPPPPTSGQTLPTGINRIDGELSSALSGDGQGTTDVDIAIVDT